MQPLHAGLPAESVSDQKVAVAAEKVDRRSARGQLGQVAGNPAAELAGRVVADPGLEQVAHDVESVCIPRRPIDEVDEQAGGFGPIVLQVQVGDQVACRCRLTQRARPAR